MTDSMCHTPFTCYTEGGILQLADGNVGPPEIQILIDGILWNVLAIQIWWYPATSLRKCFNTWNRDLTDRIIQISQAIQKAVYRNLLTDSMDVLDHLMPWLKLTVLYEFYRRYRRRYTATCWRTRWMCWTTWCPGRTSCRGSTSAYSPQPPIRLEQSFTHFCLEGGYSFSLSQTISVSQDILCFKH